MQVSMEAGEGLQRKIHVKVDEAELQKQVDKRLNELSRSVRIPGFRPGKVPRKVVVQRYGRQVRDEIVGQVLQSSFRDAIDDQQLRPAGSPRIDPLDAEPGQGLSYTAEFDVYPDVDLGDLSALTVQRPVATIGDDDVEQMITKLRNQRRNFVVAERAAQSGDRVRIDFEGKLDGEKVEGASGEDFPVELGGAGMVPGFEEALEGLSAGESKTFPVTFPEAYPAPNLAGREVEFTVKVLSVEAGELPELDNAFAASFGVADGGVTQLRADIRSNMQRELTAALNARTQEAVADEMYARLSVDIPASLLEQEAAALDAQRRQALESSGAPVAELEGEAKEALHERARRRVSVGLLMSEVIKQAELKPDGARVRQHIDALASTYEDSEAVVRYFYSEADRLQEVESQVLQEQAVEWLLQKVRVVEESTTFNELTTRT